MVEAHSAALKWFGLQACCWRLCCLKCSLLGPYFLIRLQHCKQDAVKSTCVLQKAEVAQGSIRSVFKNQFTRVNTVSLWGENVRIICCWIIFIREKQRCLWIWYMFLKIGGM